MTRLVSKPKLVSLLLSVCSLLILAVYLPATAYDLKDNAIMHAQNGQLFMERGQYIEAAEEFKAALRLNPYTSMSASLYNNLGLAYRHMQNWPMAYASFQHAIRIQPTYSLYYKNLIETYAAAGRLSAVEATLKGVTKLNADDAEAWFLLGLLYRETGNKKQAQVCLKHFLNLEPSSSLAEAARSAL